MYLARYIRCSVHVHNACRVAITCIPRALCFWITALFFSFLYCVFGSLSVLPPSTAVFFFHLRILLLFRHCCSHLGRHCCSHLGRHCCEARISIFLHKVNVLCNLLPDSFTYPNLWNFALALLLKASITSFLYSIQLSVVVLRCCFSRRLRYFSIFSVFFAGNVWHFSTFAKFVWIFSVFLLLHKIKLGFRLLL